MAQILECFLLDKFKNVEPLLDNLSVLSWCSREQAQFLSPDFDLLLDYIQQLQERDSRFVSW